MNACDQPALSLLCSPNPSPWDGATHSQGGSSHLNLPNLETPSQTGDICLLGDSISYQVNNTSHPMY